MKTPKSAPTVLCLALLLAVQIGTGSALPLCAKNIDATSSNTKEIQLLRLIPTLDKLPERRMLKGSVGHDEGPEGIPVNIFGFSEVASKDAKGGAPTVQIGYVKPYTAAWRSGLTAGDKVLATKVQLRRLF